MQKECKTCFSAWGYQTLHACSSLISHMPGVVPCTGWKRVRLLDIFVSRLFLPEAFCSSLHDWGFSLLQSSTDGQSHWFPKLGTPLTWQPPKMCRAMGLRSGHRARPPIGCFTWGSISHCLARGGLKALQEPFWREGITENKGWSMNNNRVETRSWPHNNESPWFFLAVVYVAPYFSADKQSLTASSAVARLAA